MFFTIGIILAIACFVQLLVQIVLWRLLFFQHIANTLENNHKISVIICAHNEAQNLKNHLPKILEQNYTDFEVLVVDDRSTDRSLTILEHLQKEFAHLRILSIHQTPADWNSKKYALTQGITHARNEWLLLTDADCVPASESWIYQIQSHITPQKNIVLGFSPYLKENGLLNQLIQYETLFTGLQYLGLANIGLPYMGVGRNLLYKKSLILKNQGFEKYQGITGGDDDLWIGQIANAQNTAICVEPKSYMFSVPKQRWKGWYRQKIRHLSVGIYYNPKTQFILGLWNASQLFFWIFGIIFVFLQRKDFFSTLLLCFMITRIGLYWLVLGLLNRKLKTQNSFLLIPFFDFIYTFLIFIIGLNAIRIKNIQWK